MASTLDCPRPLHTPSQVDDIRLGTPNSQAENGRLEEQPGASNTTNALEPLELTGVVKLRIVSAAFCFFNAAVNDGSIGAPIPYILRSYNIITGSMAVPYGVAFFGWLLAAIFGGHLRVTLGPGGYIIVGATLQFFAQLLRFWMPPFRLFSVSFFFVALGQTFQDSQANTFVATIKNAHRWLGHIHGCYVIGCLVGPLIAAAIAPKFKGHWASFYVCDH